MANKRTITLTPIMKEVLLLLQKEGPKKDLELFATIPNFSLDVLGKLRQNEYIDHHFNLVYITSLGEKFLLTDIEPNESNY